MYTYVGRHVLYSMRKYIVISTSEDERKERWSKSKVQSVKSKKFSSDNLIDRTQITNQRYIETNKKNQQN